MTKNRTVRLVVPIGGKRTTWELLDNPLGWRWWQRGGLPISDPIEGHRYGQTRCVPLGQIENGYGQQAFVCAMELDGALALVGTFSLFPILEQTDEDLASAAAFVGEAVARHSLEPELELKR